MSYRFTYGSSVTVLPADALKSAGSASKKDLLVLLALGAQNQLLYASLSVLAKAAGVSEKEAENALSFWRGAGVIAPVDEEEADLTETQTAPALSGKEPTVQPTVITERGLPVYTAEELDRVVKEGDLRPFIDECQRVFGKIFNTAEINIAVGLVDYLGFAPESVLLILSHCARREKKSIRYAEKMALSLHDEGIVRAADLEEYLRSREILAGEEGKVRDIFGIGTRRLSAKEKNMVEKWICEMKYGEEILRRAYDCMIDATGNISLSYANSILERWFAAGYKTVQEVDKALEDYKRAKTGGKSFDADDFFAAALKKSYGEN